MPVPTMKGRPRRIRLSPNEEARILREEREKRRKIRLQQVRDQAKINASKVREAVKEEKAHQVSILAAEIKNEWELEKSEKLRKLNEHHLDSLQHVGDAHVNAAEEVPREIEDALISQQNLQKATQRHLEAIRRMREKREEEETEARRHIIARKFALSQEKERAAVVAALPPTAPDPLEEVDIPKVRPIKLTDMNAFSLTHYHLPSEEYAVERAQEPEQTDAKAAAEVEQKRIDQLEEDERIEAHGRFEKAQLRHKHARKKEVLKQDYNAMLLDLSDLRRSDIARRQQVVAKIPRSVFQAPHRRQEEKEDEQRNMEAAFEDMYMAATDHHRDLALALEPQPAPSDGSSMLDISVDPAISHLKGKDKSQTLPLKDLTNLSVQSLQSMAKSNESGLSRLMQRIQRQRETWVDRSSHGGVAVGDMASAHDAQQKKQPIPPDSNSSLTTTPTMTQYTLTSGDGSKASSSKASTLDDTSSISTGTMSKVSSVKSSSLGTITTVTSSDISTTTLDTIEEGTLTSTSLSHDGTTQRPDTSDTLLHPMEIAAKVRHKPLGNIQKPMSSFVDHLFPPDPNKIAEDPKPNTQLVVEDFRQEQQKLERERQEIERKIKELERQAMIKPVVTIQEQIRPEPLGKDVDNGLTTIPLPQTISVPENIYGHSATDYSKKAERDYSHPEDKISAITKELSTLTDSHEIFMEEPVDKVQLYKQRALDRYREKQRQNRLSGAPLVDTSYPPQERIVADIPDPLTRNVQGLGHFEDVSIMTRSASDRASPTPVHSINSSLPTTSPKSKTSSPPQPQQYSVKEAQNANVSGDFSSYDIQGKQFDTRQSQLKAQLAEIQRQKNEILERQNHHHNEMLELKKRWQQELQQYSATDSLISESISLSMARTKAELEVELSRSHNSDKSSPENKLEDDADGGLELISDHRHKLDKKSKGPKVINLPNKSPHISHDLSTIQEMDTPVTEKKQPGFTSRPLNSTELSQVPDKLPDKPAVRALFVDMYSNKHPPSPKLSGTLQEAGYGTRAGEVFMPGVSRVDPNQLSPGFPLEHPVNQSWNVASWMAYQSKQEYTPSVDRVQQIERLPHTTPGELVLTDVELDVNDVCKVQPDTTALSASMSTGPIQDETDIPTDSASVITAFTRKLQEEAQKQKPFTYSSYLRGEDGHGFMPNENDPLPSGSYLRESDSKEPQSLKGPISLGSYITDFDKSGKILDPSSSIYPTGSYPSDLQNTDLKRGGHLPTGSFLRDEDHLPGNDKSKTPLSLESYLRNDMTSDMQKHLCSVPVGSYLQDGTEKKETPKKDGGAVNVSYLTPPKMTPTRSTDKIVRCVTTRAFGCERPTTWRGMKKPVVAAPAEPLIPVNRVVDEGNRVMSPEIVKEPPPPPSVIKQMFERSNQESKEPFAVPNSASPIPRDRRSKGFSGQQALFLSSTPSSVKATSRLDKTEERTAIQTPKDISTGRLSESHLSSGKLKDENSMMSQMSQYLMSQTSGTRNSTIQEHTNGEKLNFSDFSQHTLDSDGLRSKTPGNLSANITGLQQGRLTLSGMSINSLSQHTLEDSSTIRDARKQSDTLTPSVMYQSQSSSASKFELLMDTSKSSQGSSLSAQGNRPSIETQSSLAGQNQYGSMPHGTLAQHRNTMPFHNMMPLNNRVIPSSAMRAGPSAEVVDLAANISVRAEAAMLKYDRLMEESRRLREQYEAEERVLITETGSSSSQSNETLRQADIRYSEANISRSLEKLAAEETGISEEPDLTLVSAASSPQKSPSQSGRSSGSKDLAPLAANGNSNKTDQPGSLLSFEQHEQSLATTSQVSLIHPSASDDKTSTMSAIASLPSDTESIIASASTHSDISSTTSQLGATLVGTTGHGKDDQGQGSGSEMTHKPLTGGQSHLSKTLASWKKNNALQSQNKVEAPVAVAGEVTVVDTSSEDRKKKEKEMKERTERLYSRLDDVKQQRLEKERKETYAKNRQRQQEYQKNYQEQLRKKIQSKK